MVNEEPTKSLLVVLVIIGALFTLLHLLYGARNILHEIHVNEIRWYDSPTECQKSTNEHEDKKSLISKTFQILQNIGAEPTVCFGTLWGALREQDFLPWDPRVDICTMASAFNNVSFVELQKEFSDQNVSLSSYDWWRGHYEVKLRNASGTINVFGDCTLFFYITHSQYRIGENPGEDIKLSHWSCPYAISSILLSNMDNVYRPFPSWLLKGPFSTKYLVGLPVSVPHDNIEIQKYIYPNDWWIERKPEGC